MIKLISLLTLFLLPNICMPAVSTWEIVPKESSLTITGTLNDVPTTGKFKSFTADIHFDPNKPNESSALLSIDMNSITTSYMDIANTLKTSDWFDAKLFPKATFKSSKFIKKEDKTFQAPGTLTIRDKSLPIDVAFTVDQNAANKIIVNGKTSLKRSDFGIGKGEWASTETVKNEVEVAFHLTVIRKSKMRTIP